MEKHRLKLKPKIRIYDLGYQHGYIIHFYCQLNFEKTKVRGFLENINDLPVLQVSSKSL